MIVQEEVKCWGGVHVPLVYDNHSVCNATHHDKPNFSGHSRGRKVHLVKDGTKTFCNMLIDQYMPSNGFVSQTMLNGMCKSCLKAIKK